MSDIDKFANELVARATMAIGATALGATADFAAEGRAATVAVLRGLIERLRADAQDAPSDRLVMICTTVGDWLNDMADAAESGGGE